MNARLEQLYMSFKSWCSQNHKYSGLTGLSMNKLKMTSSPDLRKQLYVSSC